MTPTPAAPVDSARTVCCRRRRWGAASAILLLLAGCSPVAQSPSPDASAPGPIATSSPPAATIEASQGSTSSPTAAPTAIPSLGPPTADGWIEVAAPVVAGVQLLDVAWTGNRFLAIGEGKFFESVDGLAWGPTTGPTLDQFANLVVGPRGIIAWDGAAERPGTWTSPDGVTWVRRDNAFPAPNLGSNSYRVTGIVGTEAGWVAVGRVDPECFLDCGVDPVSAIAWTSSDGLTWTKVPDQRSLLNAGMNAVTRGGPGFIAVGMAPGTSLSHGLVWTSNDGQTWNRLALSAVFAAPSSLGGLDATMASVAASGGAIVAVGQTLTQDEGLSALAWLSTDDGIHWTRGTGQGFADGQMFDVATVPRGFLGAGPSGGAGCAGGIWTSPDGQQWDCVASDAAFRGFAPYAIAASPTIEVVVGFTSSDDEGVPVGSIWVRPIR